MPSAAMNAYSTTALLERLVAFDTASRNSNLDLIGFIRDYLDRHGVPYRETRDTSGQRANLHAIIGPVTAGGIALSGHVDTVPADPRQWPADPFRLRERDGRLHGRGACDMKGFVASMLAAVPDLVALRPARPIHLFITFDEEVSMEGARRLIDDLAAADLRPALCIVGEPSLMQPIVAHKGRLAVDVTVRGRSAHSSDPRRGVNAVQHAATAIAWLAAEAQRREAEGPFAEGFEPPYTTLQVGPIAGGAALNIVPDHCKFSVEWRPIPGDDAEAALEQLRAHLERQVVPAMRAVDGAAGVAVGVTDWVPGMSLDPGHALATLVRRAAGSNASGHVSYATEGGLYQRAEIPTIVCGPGSIEQAHTNDEWIAREQLDACDGFIRRLVGHYLAS